MELLYIQKGKNSHYILIENFNRLMFTFTKYKETKYFCMR